MSTLNELANNFVSAWIAWHGDDSSFPSDDVIEAANALVEYFGRDSELDEAASLNGVE